MLNFANVGSHCGERRDHPWAFKQIRQLRYVRCDPRASSRRL